MDRAARFLEELTAAGVTLGLRGSGLTARGPAKELERFGPRLKACKAELVAVLSRKTKCRHCLHATPAATCARGRPWPGAEILHTCPEHEPRPEEDEWKPAKPVRCENCAHFHPHDTRPREMPGKCGLDEKLQWPWQRTHRCAGFEVKK